MQPALLVRLSDAAARPWQNGGGVTRELLALPAGDDWRVRVSVAEVASDGPFSSFPGVDRWFAVLDGAGVVLTIDGSERCVTPSDDAVAFRGDATTHCRTIDGATRDLNLMLRSVDGALARVVPGETWRPQSGECGLYATSAGSCVASTASSSDPAHARMPAHALRWWSAAPAALAFDGSGWWLRADTSAAAARAGP